MRFLFVNARSRFKKIMTKTIFVRSLIVFFFIHATFQIIHAQRSKKFFRKDYTYIEELSSFYKVHTLHKNWMEAKEKCAREGAYLFYPEDSNEAQRVISFWNITQPYYHWVYIGVSDLLVKEVYETIDGRPISDVYSQWGPGEPNDSGGVEDCIILRRDGSLNDDSCERKYPFICKKTLDSLEWNQNCDMPGTDYSFNKDLGKCYKFHLDPRNWTEAVAICSSEQSYLSVINSQAEADYLVTLTEQAPKDRIKGDFRRDTVLLGFHNRNNDGWKSIKSTTLEDTGYSKWATPEGEENTAQCGSMLFVGYLNGIGCNEKSFYICEHEISSLSDSYDDRISSM